jgi:hypothetical protein
VSAALRPPRTGRLRSPRPGAQAISGSQLSTASLHKTAANLWHPSRPAPGATAPRTGT